MDTNISFVSGIGKNIIACAHRIHGTKGEGEDEKMQICGKCFGLDGQLNKRYYINKNLNYNPSDVFLKNKRLKLLCGKLIRNNSEFDFRVLHILKLLVKHTYLYV